MSGESHSTFRAGALAVGGAASRRLVPAASIPERHSPKESYARLSDLLRRQRLLVVTMMVVGVVAASITLQFLPSEVQAETYLLLGASPTLVELLDQGAFVGTDDRHLLSHAVLLGRSPALSIRVAERMVAAGVRPARRDWLPGVRSPEALADRLAGRWVDLEEDAMRPGVLRVVARASTSEAATFLADAFADEVLERLRRSTAEAVERAVVTLEEARREIARELASLETAVDAPHLNRERQRLDDRAAEIDRMLHAAAMARRQGASVLHPLDSAIVSSAGGARRRLLVSGFGLLFGLVLGVSGAALRERLDDRVQDPRTLMREGLPVPCLIPHLNNAGIMATPGASTPAALSRLLAACRSRHDGRSGDLVILTGATSGAGVTTLAAGLAAAAARQGLRTLLIDANLHRPRAHLHFVLEGQSGRSGRSGVALWRTGMAPLWIITAAHGRPPATARWTADDVEELLAGARRRFDLIVVDTPPAAMASDAPLFGEAAGGVFLVTRADHTRAGRAGALALELAAAGAPVLCAILNGYGHRARPWRRRRMQAA